MSGSYDIFGTSIYAMLCKRTLVSMNLLFHQILMNAMKVLIHVISVLHVRIQLEVMSVTASVDSQGMVSIAPVS